MSATVFDTPLRARSLIEASAGTGKTWALAGLFARAVIAERLRVPQVLAVTYTVAATQELHERVRLRLQQAALLARAWRDGDPPEAAGDGADAALLRRLIHAALADGRESPEALRRRLQRAARELDLAAITTIHGFCQRVLAEHALEAGQPLLAAELVPGNAAQRSALAVALWRTWSRDAADADFLQRWFGGVDALANALRDLLAPEPLLPAPPLQDDVSGSAARQAHQLAWNGLCDAIAQHGEAALVSLQAAIAGKVLSGNKYKGEHVHSLFAWLLPASRHPTPPGELHERLDRFTPDALRAGCNKGQQPPESPLWATIDAFLVARAAYLRAQEACDLQRLHALRADARRRDAADKQAFHYRDYDDLVGAVYDATRDPAVAPGLATALRTQFPLVLVDEFQDTDARQWAIFERLFGTPDDGAAENGLLLVGDPKQAIYRFRGGDVETYLQARAGAQAAAPLRRNFRARPCVLAAVNALFGRSGLADDALGARIRYEPGETGRAPDCDAHLQRDGRAMPALTFQAVPARAVEKNGRVEHKDWDKPESTRIAARLCAGAIAALLRDAQAGRASRVDGDAPRPLLPRDMAVLVREHREASAVRHALAECGVPAVSAGRGSLFDAPQARTLLSLLLALAAPGDERRLRAALATPLFGFDAAALCALEEDGDALRRWQDDVMRWRLRWEQHGPQAMLAEVVAAQARRLLALADGERELTSLLHLGELLQEARASAFDTRGFGPRGQIAWLQRAIAHADAEDEAQWPRLESDAGRVQILTLHKSKGLEFPLVFLPFAGIGRGDRQRGKVVDYHDAEGVRVRQWQTGFAHGDEPAWDAACVRAKAEDQAEDMRLLYVGLTRARDALWVCGGALANNGNAALHRLLGGSVPGAELQLTLDGLLDLQEHLPPTPPTRVALPSAAVVPAPRTPTRALRRDWWIHSFSQLHRQRPHGTQALVDESPADDERPLAVLDPAPSRFGGTRFGNAMHQALEHVDFARWRDCDGSVVPDGELRHLELALQAQDYAGDDIAEGACELAQLIARTLNAALPLSGAGHPRASSPARAMDAPSDAPARAVRLCDVPPSARVAELEFHFTLADTDSRALLALLHAHGIAAQRQDFGAWPRLSGLMNGKIDLTCRIDGRVYVLDYKSNRLPDHAEATLRQAMAASEYDLQALLYVVAVHRWLRLRLGADYDYDRDVGGALYLFCRGLEAGGSQGIATLAFPRALVEGVDALFGDGGRA